MTTVHWASGGSLVGSERNLTIARWDGVPTVDQLRAIGAANDAIATTHPGGGGLLNVVIGGTPRFDEALRTEAMRLARIEGARGLGAAHVVLVPGLAGMTVRTFFSTLTLVSQPKSPTRTFDDLDAAASWLAERLSPVVRWSGREILRAWNQLPRSLGATR